MTALTKALVIAGVAVGIAGAAFAQTSHQSHGSAPTPEMDAAAMQQMMQDSMPKPSDPASTKDFKEADMRMMKNMHVNYTGDPDVDFRTHMIPHHQGAVDMAKVARKHPETKRMAENIIKDQEREIGEMQAWLKKHGH